MISFKINSCWKFFLYHKINLKVLLCGDDDNDNCGDINNIDDDRNIVWSW